MFAELSDSANAQAKDDVAEIEGRKLDYADVDADNGSHFDDIVGTTQPISTELEHVPTEKPPTASERVSTDTQEVTTAEEEDVARKRAIKGKEIVTYSEQEQTRKISKKDQAQIDFDARMAEKLVADEIEKKKKNDEDEVAVFASFHMCELQQGYVEFVEHK
jgi:hypothetical protein